MSRFFTDVPIDTGLFPAFAPFSYSYYNMGGCQTVFVLLAVASAVAADNLRKNTYSEIR